MKLYMIKHYYDVEADFGDAVEKEDCILIFNDKSMQNFSLKYLRIHMYMVSPIMSYHAESLKSKK